MPNCNSCNNPLDETILHNWYAVSNLPCNPCETITVCKNIMPSTCIRYNGVTLQNLGIADGRDFNIYITLDDIFLKLDAIKQIQDIKNTNILNALNDINSRINSIVGGTPHPPYTLL